MNKRPDKVQGTRLCLCLTHEGLTVYCNRESFVALGEYMHWLANSDEKDYYECHVTMSLEDEASKFDGKRPRNTWVLLEKDLSNSFPIKIENNPGFELTFMRVPPDDLEEMAAYQDHGILPDHWNEQG